MEHFIRRLRWALVAVAAMVALATPSFAQTTVKPFAIEQTPCSVPCLTYWNDDPSPALVRSWAYAIPAPGRVVVTVNGSVQCDNQASTNDNFHGVVDLGFQIVTISNTVPSAIGPSGIRLASRIAPAGISSTFSVPFNLATTRTLVYTTSGTKAVYLRLIKNRMDANTVCLFSNVAFSMIYLPQ